MNRRLRALHDAGVSIWLDTLSRELLESGGFASLIAEYCVTGATSNPTIFAKAIERSHSYDSMTSAEPPTCSARPTTQPRGATGSSPSSALPISRTTPRAQ